MADTTSPMMAIQTRPPTSCQIGRRPFPILCLLLLVVVVAPVAARGAETEFPGRHWKEAAPASQGLDAGRLKAAVDSLAKRCGRDGVRQLVVVRNGRIVWKGDDVDNVHGVWSVTKSFTSTALGLLVDDGKCALDTPAAG